MSQYDIIREDGRLTLRKGLGDRLTGTGCLLFFCAFLSILFVGMLSLMQDVEFVGTGPQAEATRFFHPRHNHFGYFWGVGSLLMLVLVPVYVVHAYRSALTFRFDRIRQEFSRNGKLITRLPRIEYVWIRETQDPDRAYLYQLLVVYEDGYEMPIDVDYDEREIVNLAKEIAGFLDVAIVWK